MDSDDDSLDKCDPSNDPYNGKEPLMPGDKIAYTAVGCTSGDRYHRKVAQVIATNPKRKFKIQLDNGDLLPKDSRRRRSGSDQFT